MVPCRFYRIIDQRGPTTDNINTIHMMKITELIDYLLSQTGNSPLNGIKDQISFCFVIYNLPGNDSNLLIVFYVQIMPDDFVMQFHRF